MNIRRYITTVLIVFVVNIGFGNNPSLVEFENAPEELTESGYIKLSWRWRSHINDIQSYEFELQQSNSKNFDNSTTIYKGADFATFLSGLKNGSYYYRVRGIEKEKMETGEWSNPVLVKVEHHSLRLAFTLFGIGATVFFLTVGIIIWGNRTVLHDQ